MPKFHVVSQETLDHMIEDGIDFRALEAPKDIVSLLSANDLAESVIAHSEFHYPFDKALDITIMPNVIDCLKGQDAVEQYERLLSRVMTRVETTLLADRASLVKSEMCNTYIYTLHPVDDNLWVVGAQRHSQETNDPQRLGLKKNHAFFDALIAQSLHLLPFETVSSTNLLAYYLRSISE
jgi:hypothetical protein